MKTKKQRAYVGPLPERVLDPIPTLKTSDARAEVARQLMAKLAEPMGYFKLKPAKLTVGLYKRLPRITGEVGPFRFTVDPFPDRTWRRGDLQRPWFSFDLTGTAVKGFDSSDVLGTGPRSIIRRLVVLWNSREFKKLLRKAVP